MSDDPGFFIPYRYAAATQACDYPAIAPLFDQARGRFTGFLDTIGRYREAFAQFGGEPPAPRFDQDWFPRLDACAGYAMVRVEKPRLLVEIGSGHSTRIMARAIADAKLDTDQLCIDPAPRATLAGLALRWRQATLDQLADAEFAGLASADLLFIDSSHIAMPGTDVDRLINGLLPRLRPGSIVHFHDVFLPHAYPEEWAWRGYNEQLLIAALLSGGAFELLFASHYVRHAMQDAFSGSFAAGLPLVPGAFENSLWLRKR